MTDKNEESGILCLNKIHWKLNFSILLTLHRRENNLNKGRHLKKNKI